MSRWFLLGLLLACGCGAGQTAAPPPPARPAPPADHHPHGALTTLTTSYWNARSVLPFRWAIVEMLLAEENPLGLVAQDRDRARELLRSVAVTQERFYQRSGELGLELERLWGSPDDVLGEGAGVEEDEYLAQIPPILAVLESRAEEVDYRLAPYDEDIFAAMARDAGHEPEPRRGQVLTPRKLCRVLREAAPRMTPQEAGVALVILEDGTALVDRLRGDWLELTRLALKTGNGHLVVREAERMAEQTDRAEFHDALVERLGE